MENLLKQVITWAEERNIVQGSSLEKETLKLISHLGSLTNFIDNVDICRNGIGHCMIGMIIICRMRNITLDESVRSTKPITDERIAESKLALIMIFKYTGKLAEDISMSKDIKADIGHLLIYLTALANTLQLSTKECVEDAFNEIKGSQWVIFDGVVIDENDEKYSTALAIIKSINQSRD